MFCVTVDVPKGEKLGIMLAGGNGNCPISIQTVYEGSLASICGLYGGLQIMSVNGTIFNENSTHHDAIVALTSSEHLAITVKELASKEDKPESPAKAVESDGQAEDMNIKEDMSYGVQKSHIGTTLSIYLQKRHAIGNFHLVEVASSLWIAGWNQKEPALTGKFHVGDQLLSLNGQPVTTVAEAFSIMDMTPSGVELLLKRMPSAVEYKLYRKDEDESWGMQIRQNRLVDVIHGSIAWMAGLQPFSAQFRGEPCAWAVTQVNGVPVSILCRSTDVIVKKIDGNAKDTTIVFQPSEFVTILSNSLRDRPHYEDFVARS